MSSRSKGGSDASDFSVEGEDVAQIRDSSQVSIKLDVMSSKQFNRLTFLNFIIILYTFLHVIFISTACGTIWKENVKTKGVRGETITLKNCKAPRIYSVPLYVIDIIASSCLTIAALLFTIRIIRTEVRKSKEQIWTVIMVVMTALSYNPIGSIQALNDTIIYPRNREKWLVVLYPWFNYLLLVNRAISLSISSVGQLFYVWTNAHTFGILEEIDQPSNLRFYGLKIIILTIYNVYRLMLASLFHISPSKLPGTTGVAMFVHFRILKEWDTDVFLKVMVLIIIELIIMIAIVRRMCITATVLREAQYLKYRGKQIGFRYFVMQNIITYSLFLFADTSILVLVPRFIEVRMRLQAVTKFRNIFYNFIYGPVPRLLNYTTTAITAYVNLPADSVGLMGWFKGSVRNDQDEKEPITLTARSKKTDFNVNHMSSCIVFELLVELFSVSEIAYLMKSSAVKSQMANEYANEKGYFLELEIFNEENETYATVFTTEDKIIVAFKGTTTVENMKTDINMKMVGISNTFPSMKNSRHRILSSLDWKNAKIHKGFAKAYSSVSDELIEKIATIHAKKERPVYFTGHSLGASLATIASLDVILSLNIKNAYVVTFGSPRCGNLFWGRAYDQMAKAHWRVAMRSDIVTTLPRSGYSHVGKRVALTTSGDIFLDPNAIETILWSSAGVNVTDHGKQAYKKALTLFCGKYLPGFEPEFIRKEADTRVF